jgi:hypothetical protein
MAMADTDAETKLVDILAKAGIAKSTYEAFYDSKGCCQECGLTDVEMADGVPKPEDLWEEVGDAVEDYCNDAQEFYDMTFDVVNRKVIFHH